MGRTGPGTLGSVMAALSKGLRRPLRSEASHVVDSAPRRNNQDLSVRGVQGHVRVGENDAMSIEEASRRVRNELQRTGPVGGTARLPSRELDARPSVAPQVSHWEVRGPVDLPPRDAIPRPDFHGNNEPLLSRARACRPRRPSTP